MTAAKHIKLLILDVDGVLTDGKIWFELNGTENKAFNTQDGFGITKIQQAGITVAVISGRNSPLVAHRMEALGVEHIYQGQPDKQRAFDELLKILSLEPQQVAYVGDDTPDLKVMQQVGFSIAVNNATPEILAMADWRTTRNGGDGAVRQACDHILQAQTP